MRWWCGGNNSFVIPGRDQRVRATRGPMTGSVARPESITPACGDGFRAHRFAMSRNDDAERERGSPPLEIRDAPLCGCLHAFLEILGDAQAVLLDQLVVGCSQHAVG